MASLRAHSVSFVHQNLGLMPSLTVLENLLLPDFAVGARLFVNWRAEAKRARELFARYDLDLDPLRPLSDLSPVARAQLAIVRAFNELRGDDGRARGLLVLDEPTPFLPAHDVDALFRLVREIVADGASVIFVSHDIDEVLEITDRATVLRDGRVAGVFDTAAVIEGRGHPPYRRPQRRSRSAATRAEDRWRPPPSSYRELAGGVPGAVLAGAVAAAKWWASPASSAPATTR